MSPHHVSSARAFVVRLACAAVVGFSVPVRSAAQNQLIVGPKGEATVVFPNTSGSVGFSLTGLTQGQSYGWSWSCSGAVTSCTSAPGNPPNPFTATAYGQDVTINFSVGYPWTGSVSLSAQGGGGSDAGSWNVTLNNNGPVVSTRPTNGDYRDVSKCVANCFDGVASYSTVPHYSADVPRSVHLSYRSAQAHPMGIVQVDAVDTSNISPVKMSIQLYTPQGTRVTFTNGSTEIFYNWAAHPADGNVNRLAAEFDASSLATGAYDNYFGHPEWEHDAPGLKSIIDATSIRRDILLAFEAAEIETDLQKVQELLTFVLVGAGPTGVEMAGAIAELAHKALASDFRHIDTHSARIILIEAAPRILAAFPESLARKTRKRLKRMGVKVMEGTPVTQVDDKRIDTHTVIWSAGVTASPAGKWLGAEVDRAGRVKVTNDLSVPTHPNVFVIGDTASVMQDGKPLPGVAPVAMQAGRYVASLIAQRAIGKQEHAPFHYRNKGNLATVGRSYAIVEMGKLRLTGLVAWVIWLVVHIYYLIGFRNRLITMFQWAWTYLTYSRGARLITFEKDREP